MTAGSTEPAPVRVVVVGSTNLDLVVTTTTLPRPGETVLGGALTTVPGGKGANQAVAAARAGASCAFVGAVGQDGFADQLRANLTDSGVDVRGLREVPGPSGVALVAVDTSAENLIVVAPGANGELTSLADPDRVAIEAADVLLCQLEVPLPAVVQAARWARGAGTTVVLNAAPARPLPAELLDAVELLVVNQVEAAVVAGQAGGEQRNAGDDAPEAGGARAATDGGDGGGGGGDGRGGGREDGGGDGAGEHGAEREALVAALLALVPRVVMTLGADGACYADRYGLRLEVEAPQIEAVDTTAAGDAFTGALAVAWVRRRGLVERAEPAEPAEETAAAAVAVESAEAAAVAGVLRWACAAGAVCAQRPGASSALPTRSEIDALYARTWPATATNGLTGDPGLTGYRRHRQRG